MQAKRTAMTRILTVSALVASLAASHVAHARAPFKAREFQDSFHDTAWVVARTPVYEESNTPRRECWTEQVGSDAVSTLSSRSYGGAIIGAIAGGILGNQVGKGTGKTVATAVGAATGAIVGDSLDNRGIAATRPRYEERCRVIDQWERRLTGYNVVYRYSGREYTAFLPYDPGDTVRVRVQVSLAE